MHEYVHEDSNRDAFARHECVLGREARPCAFSMASLASTSKVTVLPVKVLTKIHMALRNRTTKRNVVSSSKLHKYLFKKNVSVNVNVSMKVNVHRNLIMNMNMHMDSNMNENVSVIVNVIVNVHANVNGCILLLQSSALNSYSIRCYSTSVCVCVCMCVCVYVRV